MRAAKPADIGALADVLAGAFASDPYFSFTSADDQTGERLRSFFTGTLRFFSHQLSDTLTTRDLSGVAIWLPPGHHHATALESLRMLPSLAELSGWRRLPMVLSSFGELDKRHERLVPGPHWYLLALGVRPGKQGRGIGTALMSPVLERCDRKGLPAYLETALERNLRLYERNGFRVVESLNMPKSTVPGWLMRRDPS